MKSYTCGFVTLSVAFGLHSYYVRELWASLALFSAAFFFLAVLTFAGFLVFWTSVQLAIRARLFKERIGKVSSTRGGVYQSMSVVKINLKEGLECCGQFSRF